MPHREAACAIIVDDSGRFLLQRRDNKPHVFHPGKIGLFGGHREGDETYLECLMRELREELTYSVVPESIEHFLTYEGPDMERDAGTLRIECFIVRGIAAERTIVTEGKMLAVNHSDVSALMTRMTPFSIHAFRAYFSKSH